MDPISHPARLLDQVRNRIRLKHYSIRTEQAYVDWIRRYIHFHGKRHPAAMGVSEIETFLTDLAVARHVAAATQNQARSALLFLYREILAIELPWLEGVQPAKASTRLPVVLTQKEVADVLARLEGTHRLIGALLYGSGMRIMEGVRLRVKDVEFTRGEIVVRDGKGAKDRMTMLPRNLAPRLRVHLVEVRELHKQDLGDGCGATWLPNALQLKYPGAACDWAWQYVFPSRNVSRDPRGGAIRRHHVSDQAFQRAIRQPVRDAGIVKPATPHTLRNSFATQLLEAGYDIRTVQE
jgi:integron integrase